MGLEALIHVSKASDWEQVFRPSGRMPVVMKKKNSRIPTFVRTGNNMEMYIHCLKPMFLSNMNESTIIQLDLVCSYVATREYSALLSMI